MPSNNGAAPAGRMPTGGMPAGTVPPPTVPTGSLPTGGAPSGGQPFGGQPFGGPSFGGAPAGGSSFAGMRPPTGTPGVAMGGFGAPPLGLPSECQLTRLANELFSALPGGGTASKSGADPSTFNSASSSRFGVVEEERLRTTLGPRMASSHGGPVSTTTAAAAPGMSTAGIPNAAFPTAGAPSAGMAQPPGTPGIPSQSSFPASPPSPSMSGLPGVSSFPGAPSTSSIPGATGLPSAQPRPSLSGMPATPSGAGYPAPAHPASPFYFLNENHLFGRGAPDATGLREASPLVTKGPTLARRPFDVNAVRRDFPILQERVNGGKPLVWLDNAATTHKPQVVIDRLSHFYAHENSNIHRAAHALAARASDAYEQARETVARFINAPSSKEIVFVRGATEAINLVAQAWGRQNVGKDDEILITHLEHHANIVPWQRLCQETGCTLRVAPVDDRGEVILSEFQQMLNRKTRLVAFPQVSNALGTVTPAKQMVDMAHRAGALVLVDGAQAVAHMRQDMAALDADFYVFSGHKIFAPTGIGVLYGKAELLDAMQPWQGGGNMIQDVTLDKSTYQAAPARFEAGTGSIADAVGLGAALEYLEGLGIENIAQYEHDLMAYASDSLQTVPDLRLIGTAPEKAGVLSFVIDGLRNEDIGSALSHEGIAVRSGHHCAQPILRRFGLESTVRPSLAMYNTREEIDVLTAALKRIRLGSAGRA